MSGVGAQTGTLLNTCTRTMFRVGGLEFGKLLEFFAVCRLAYSNGQERDMATDERG